MAILDYDLEEDEITADNTETVVAIPDNRTLIVTQLTHEPPAHPRKITGLTTIGEVFDHFRPHVDVVLEDMQGRAVTENFRFGCVEDFELESIIRQSPLLSLLRTEKKQCEDRVGHLYADSSIGTAIAAEEEHSVALTARLLENQAQIVRSARELERNYRALGLFYRNTGLKRVPNITLVNAGMKQLTNLDDSAFIDYIATELKKNYDKLDLRANYSLLAVPGYLGADRIVSKWARMAHGNKVILFTDFDDLDSPDEVIRQFSIANHASDEACKSHLVMVCNWLLARVRYKRLDEESDLRLSPCLALLGKVYKNLTSQVSAGRTYGTLDGVNGLAFAVKKNEISQLERTGLIPMVSKYGQVMSFSAKTLFNGDNLGLQEYSIVRVFNHISKVLFDFLNRRSFENWNINTEKDLRRQIVRFLGSIQGIDRLIDQFQIIRLERNKNQKDQIYIDIHITPYFPAKSYIMHLDRVKVEGSTQWSAECELETLNNHSSPYELLQNATQL